MLLPPLDETTPARVMTPGHFENFVGMRLAFTGDTDRAMEEPASSIADAATSDVDRDTAGPLNELIGGVDDVGRDADLGDVAELTTAVGDLEQDLIDQQQQQLPVVDPGVTPGGAGGTTSVPIDPTIETPTVPPGGTVDPTPEPLP